MKKGGGGLEGGGNGNNDDPNNVARFPNRATRFRNSAGFGRKRPDSLPPTITTAQEKPAEIVPLTEEECLKIAREINQDLTHLALSHPTWNITEEMIEEKTALHILDANGEATGLVRYLEEAAVRDISQTKADLLMHLSAARAYLDLIELRDREKTEDR